MAEKLSERLETLVRNACPGWHAAETIREAAELARRVEWQPIETAPRDGTRVLLWYKWHDLPVVGEFRHGRWWSVHSLGGNLAYKQGMDLEEVLRPTHWRPLPAPPAIDAHLRESDKRAVADG